MASQRSSKPEAELSSPLPASKKQRLAAPRKRELLHKHLARQHEAAALTLLPPSPMLSQEVRDEAPALSLALETSPPLSVTTADTHRVSLVSWVRRQPFSDVRDGSSITGFYVTGSSFRARPTLSPIPKRPLASRTRFRAIVSRVRWFSGFTLTSFLRRKAYTHLRRRPTLSSTWTIRVADTPRYDRPTPVAERVADPFCSRFRTTSRAGRTLPVPDADPADEADLIPAPPPPPLHTTHRLAEGDHSSPPLPERSSAFRGDPQAVPEALVVF
ncbi:hypothetical protein B0H14DRAFT_3162036 [Mycena olivaceomarginata]|nr:hypothetical protein B0H14DRAFT_3162036 [Mycena olivaceomarginata]